MTRSLMVTGAAGFIGANFVYHWIQAHPNDTVVAYDALTYAGNRASLAPRWMEDGNFLKILHLFSILKH